MYKLLVIDDSETNTMLIKSVFEDESSDIEVVIENNSKNAMSVVKTIHPNLILLDLMMPGINGEDILKELKSEPHTKDIPVIVVSAKQDQSEIDTVIELGAMEYIMKPISINNLFTRVTDLIKNM